MKLPIKLSPEDFIVEEVLRLQPGGSGDYAVYRARKRLLTTLELQGRVARQLGLAPRAVVFPALKDKRAVATQHFSIRGRGPSTLSGHGFAASFVGRLPRHLGPGDLSGNRFVVALRSLPPGHAEAVAAALEAVAHRGLPNYFDEQRFGSYAPRGTFVGKAILQGDAEAALRAYLAQPLRGDSPSVRAFKGFASEHWRDWPAMYQAAPRSNLRSVVTFLKDHPEDLRKALNLITPSLLPLLLAAYQSLLWNRIASRLLEGRLRRIQAPLTHLEVAGERLVLCRSMPADLAQELQGLAIPLPHHRAAFPDGEMEVVAKEVLAEEGLGLDQLKPRLLRRAYMAKATRSLLVVPQEVDARVEAMGLADTSTLRLAFFLPPGSYGTLVLKALAKTTILSGAAA